jgi:hypothetical protein
VLGVLISAVAVSLAFVHCFNLIAGTASGRGVERVLLAECVIVSLNPEVIAELAVLDGSCCLAALI